MTIAVHSRKNRAVFVGGAAVCALLAVGARISERSFAGAASYGLSFSPASALGFVAEAFVPAQSAALSCDLFTESKRSGLFTLTLAAGASASDVYLSCCLAALVFCVAGVASLYLILAGLTMFLFGRAEAMPTIAYAVTLAPAFASVSLAALCANVFSSSFVAVACFSAFYAGLKTLGSFFDAAADASFTSYMQWHILWTGGDLPVERVANVAGLLLATGAAFLSAGFFAFTKRGRT